jgi:hypothetical protein
MFHFECRDVKYQHLEIFLALLLQFVFAVQRMYIYMYFMKNDVVNITDRNNRV